MTAQTAAADCVIVINCGSSSLKFAVFPAVGETVVLRGIAERLSTPEASLTVERAGDRTVLQLPGAGHREALRAAVDRMAGLRPRAIGHRVVHGGEEFTGSALIDDGVLAAVGRCVSLAPLHNPANLTGVRTARELFPDLPQVAVFDTAFHQTLPPEAYLYAIPYELYVEHRVRRYGFHGTSHHYVLLETARLLGKEPEETSLVTMHLGNGCSACAIAGGRSVETTMGLTPGEGLVMGTRSGDVDPALHRFLQDRTGMRLSGITDMLNSRSGLLGLSGVGNDMRSIAAAADSGHQRAALAIAVFCHRLAKSASALMASLERIDAFVFTGGIGENSASVRAITAARWQIHGVEIDDSRNALHGRHSNGLVSSASSRIPCLVVPTNEELMIARETLRLIPPSSNLSEP